MSVPQQHLSLAELHNSLDVQTREKLGLSADEFLERVQSRSLDMTSPGISRLASLGRLLLTARTKA